MSDHEIWQFVGRVVFAIIALIAAIDYLRRRRR